jgi:hypothetical protein
VYKFHFFFLIFILAKNNKRTRVLLHVSSCEYFILVSNWTRVLLHVSVWIILVSNWTRVLNTRVRLDTSIKYSCPNLTHVQFDTCLLRHVSTVTGTVDTCQNAAIFVVISTVAFLSITS